MSDKKLFGLRAMFVFLFVVGMALTAMSVSADPPQMVTICHAAGLAGTTQYVTLTIPYQAAFGQAGHFGENGTPNAGHEQDYLGACQTTGDDDTGDDDTGDDDSGDDDGGDDDGGFIPVTLCHATGSDSNPYVVITVDNQGALNGHSNHAGDIIPAPAGGCPGGDDGDDDTGDDDTGDDDDVVTPTPVPGDDDAGDDDDDTIDVCPNLRGNQTEMPEGYTLDGQGNCVPVPPVISTRVPPTGPPQNSSVCFADGSWSAGVNRDQANQIPGAVLDVNEEDCYPPPPVVPAEPPTGLAEPTTDNNVNTVQVLGLALISLSILGLGGLVIARRTK